MSEPHCTRYSFAQRHCRDDLSLSLLFTAGAIIILMAVCPAYSQGSGRLDQLPRAGDSIPFQSELYKQRLRLASPNVEERRDAVMRLGALGNPEASQIAAGALADPLPIVRAQAARAVLSLPAEEAVTKLGPLLRDRSEFVRREVAYALGLSKTRTAVPILVTALKNDKEASVRGAAAVALGQIGDDAAVIPLSEVFGRHIPKASGKLRRVRGQTLENEFVRRAAAHSLGEIHSKAAAPALIGVLSDKKVEDDVRREAAEALGQIADASSISSLREALTAPDPYLSRAAYEALMKISKADSTRLKP